MAWVAGVCSCRGRCRLIRSRPIIMLALSACQPCGPPTFLFFAYWFTWPASYGRWPLRPGLVAPQSPFHRARISLFPQMTPRTMRSPFCPVSGVRLVARRFHRLRLPWRSTTSTGPSPRRPDYAPSLSRFWRKVLTNDSIHDPR